MLHDELWHEYLEEGLRLYGHYDEAEDYANAKTSYACVHIEPFELPSIADSCYSHREKVFPNKPRG